LAAGQRWQLFLGAADWAWRCGRNSTGNWLKTKVIHDESTPFTRFHESGFLLIFSGIPMSFESSTSSEVMRSGISEARTEMRLEVPHWYAVHTSAQREKKVSSYLVNAGIEQFLPVYQDRRRWKDRVVTLETPLFTGYVFVRIAMEDKLRVLNAPGVARFVAQSGKPAVIPEEDIERIKSGLVKGAIPHPYLTVGRRVEVVRGPLAGTSGILTRKKNNLRLVVSIDSIARAMAIEVSEADVQPILNSRSSANGVA